MNPRLILPVAPPAAGKSYTARKLVDKEILYPEDVVEPDYYRELLTGDRTNQTVNRTVFEIVNSIVISRLRHGFDVYLDATNLNSGHRVEMLDKVKTIDGIQIIVLVSDLSKDILDEQNLNRPYPVPQKVLKRMWDQSQKMQVRVLSSNYKAKVYTLKEAQEWEEIP